MQDLTKIDMTFDVEVAKMFGVKVAVVLNEILETLKKCTPIDLKKAEHYFILENKIYYRLSIVELQKKISFLTYSQIRRALRILVDAGVLLVGNFSEHKMDRCNWYAKS